MVASELKGNRSADTEFVVRRGHAAQSLLAAIVESSEDAIISKTLEGVISSWNPGAERLFGYAAAEAIGQSMLLIYPPDRVNEETEILRRVSAGEHIKHLETVRRRKNGELVDVSITISPIFDNQNRVMGASSIARDITAERRNEALVRRQADLFEQTYDPTFVWEWDGPITFWNRAAESLYGYTAAEAIGRLSHDLLQSRLPVGLEAFQRELEREGRWEGEITHVARDGREIIVESRVTLVRGPDHPYVLEANRDVTAHRLAEAALRRSQEQLQSLIEQAPISIALLDVDLRYIITSDRWLTEFGRGHETLAGRAHFDVHTDIPAEWREIYRRALAGESFQKDEDLWVHADGRQQWLRWAVLPWRNARNEIGGIVISAEDITRQKQLEEQVRQAQKMDAIGRLAGGVAHDFNNILAVIEIQADLLKRDTALTPDQEEYVDDILAPVRRASALTRQLLLFSRREIFKPLNLELNHAVADIAKMIKRVLGEQVQMELKLCARPLQVFADAGMLDQILVNLCVNARDAMPHGGHLLIETVPVDFDEFAAAQSPKARPGAFVCITVSDTGTGIAPEILPRIFEPFFTTKEVGKGTGLGLATVFGIVQQHKGWISVYSELNRGTTFRVYLPRLAAAAAEAFVASTPESRRGHETVLLVEDDPSLRSSVKRMLTRLGYTVIEAPTGARALELWKAEASHVHLLLTDFVMPGGMTGRELAGRLLEKNPRLKVIYMSGYTAEVVDRDFHLEEGVNFLPKPFPAGKLSEAIRKALDS